MTERASSSANWPHSPVVRVLLAALQSRRGAAARLLALLVLLGLLPLAASLLLPSGRWQQVVRVVAGVLTITGLSGLWWLLAFNLLQQNNPQIARTVPGHVRALRCALLGSAAMLCISAGLLAGLAGGSVLLPAMAIGGVCALIGGGLRWPALWLPVALAGWIPPFLRSNGGPDWLFPAWQAAPLPIAMLVLALQAWLLSAMVMNGGRRHERAQARLDRFGALLYSQRGKDGAPRAFAQHSLRVYALWMAGLLARGDSAVGARLALGIGPRAHWVGVLVGGLSGLVVSGFFLLLSYALPREELGGMIRGSLLIGLAFSGLSALLQIPAALWATRREQALLRLLPNVPQGGALNRWLVLRLAGLHAVVLLLHTGAVLVVVKRFDMPIAWPHIGDVTLAALGLGIPLGLTLTRDWSRLHSPSGAAQLRVFAMALASGGLAAAWVMLNGGHWWTLAGAALLASLPLGWWRWQAIAQAPAAWPVGRR